jgi:hypothetical protein
MDENMSVIQGGLREFVQPQGRRRAILHITFKTTKKCLSTASLQLPLEVLKMDTGNIFYRNVATFSNYTVCKDEIRSYLDKQRQMKDKLSRVRLKSLTSGFLSTDFR